jgi:uncharacterized membrane protein
MTTMDEKSTCLEFCGCFELHAAAQVAAPAGVALVAASESGNYNMGIAIAFVVALVACGLVYMNKKGKKQVRMQAD